MNTVKLFSRFLLILLLINSSTAFAAPRISNLSATQSTNVTTSPRVPLKAVINYPQLTSLRGFMQTALKPGDVFTISVDAGGTAYNGITADLHQLGIAREMVLTSNNGNYITGNISVPKGLGDGSKSIFIHAQNSEGSTTSATIKVLVDQVSPTGKVSASFSTSNDLTNTWTAVVKGSINDATTAAHILNEKTYGIDEKGLPVEGGYTSAADIILDASGTFTYTLPIPVPDPLWKSLGYSITVSDAAGNIVDFKSKPVKAVRSDTPLIDHAIGGSIVKAPNYKVGGIPAGVGIPYSTIQNLSDGDYFAVVYFEGSMGCPSSLFTINAFMPEQYWDYDTRDSDGAASRAYSTAGGGCMQEFHIDHLKGDPWMWGALNPNMKASAIADKNGMPAFAICDTASVCDQITIHDASTTIASHAGISSLLFLPGIEGSKLYQRVPNCDDASGVCDQQLWLPQNNLYVPQLFMNPDGSSKNSIYVKDSDILSSAYNQSFYSSFVSMMGSALADKRYGNTWSWKPIAYDWRLALSDIVSQGVPHGDRIYYSETTGKPYIEQELRKLAAHSPTGKVTIVAHSNGGLVAKALLQKLGNEESQKLVDKVILIGAPQSGTPQAVAALLFGEGEELPALSVGSGLLVSKANARAFALNSPASYQLLPTQKYFAIVQDPAHPVLSFASSSALAATQNSYGETINSYQKMLSYLEATSGGRTQPVIEDVDEPAIASSPLIANSTNLHTVLDSWTPPPLIRTFELAGWGASTASGLEIGSKVSGTGKNAKPVTNYKMFYTDDGDGTVPVPSALMMGNTAVGTGNVERYWINLPKASSKELSYSHPNLLEIPEVQKFIGSVLVNKNSTNAVITTSRPKSALSGRDLLYQLSP